MQEQSYSPDELREEEVFIIKKLGLSNEEYQSIRQGPKRSFRDFPSSAFLFDLKDRAKSVLGRA